MDSRRVLLFAVVAVLAAMVPSAISAEEIVQPEFYPQSAEILGQGGSFVAVAEGYSSFFTNPAGLAMTEEPEFTLPSISMWIHSRPDLILSTIGALGGQDVETDSDDEEQSRDDIILDNLEEQFTTNGFGLGAAIGLGYVGRGIGLGFNVATDIYLYGNTFPLGIEGEMNNQISLMIGYAHPFEIGPVTIALGGQLRPTVRISSLIDSEVAVELLNTFLGVDAGETDSSGDITETITALNGWGVAVDAGMIASYRSARLGVSARNLFNTNMQYSSNTFSEVISALQSGGLPSEPEDEDDPSYVADDYVIPMELTVGAAWQPEYSFSAIFDPELHAQINDPFGTAQVDEDRPTSFWTRVHIGTELTFLRFFDLRFGLNQGYATLGYGVDFSFLEIQFALYSEEYGRYPGDQQVGGAVLEFALRF